MLEQYVGLVVVIR